ncbi:MAG: DUF3105 domain-containing protein [Actinomycetota bacterium]
MAGNQGGGGSSAEARRPTKAERRDEARRKREEIQRKMASRRRNRTIGVVLVVVALVIAVVAVFMTSGGDGTSAAGIPSADTLLSQATAATDAAGCDAVRETPNYRDAPGKDPAIDHEHIGSAPEVAGAPDLSTYATIPPASGPHDPTPLPAGIYDSPPDVYQVLHALEHGGVIVWYSPDADAAKVADLKAFYGQRQSDVSVGQDRVIVAPYDYPDQGDSGQLPAGAQLAVVSWHRLQTCSSVSLPVAFDFTSQYEFPVYDGRTYEGVAREPGGVM